MIEKVCGEKEEDMGVDVGSEGMGKNVEHMGEKN